MVLTAALAFALAALGVAALCAALVVARCRLAENQTVGLKFPAIRHGTNSQRERVRPHTAASLRLAETGFIAGALGRVASGVVDILKLDRLAVDRGEVECVCHLPCSVCACIITAHFHTCNNQMARPQKPADERQSYKLQIGFTESERESIQRTADAAGVSYTKFVRSSAIEASRHNNRFKARRRCPARP